MHINETIILENVPLKKAKLPEANQRAIQILRSAGMSQIDIATALGLSDRTIRVYEHGFQKSLTEAIEAAD